MASNMPMASHGNSMSPAWWSPSPPGQCVPSCWWVKSLESGFQTCLWCSYLFKRNSKEPNSGRGICLFQLIGNLVENVGMGHAAFLKHSVISVLLRIRRRTTGVHSKQEKMRPSFTFWLRFVPFTLQLFALGRGSCWGSASTEKSNFEPNPRHMAPNLLSAEVATGSLRPKCSRYQRYIRQPWSERNLNGYHSVAPQIN